MLSLSTVIPQYFLQRDARIYLALSGNTNEGAQKLKVTFFISNPITMALVSLSPGPPTDLRPKCCTASEVEVSLDGIGRRVLDAQSK